MLKKAEILPVIATALFVLLAVGLAGCGNEEEVFLEAGSQGQPGNGAVLDLEPGAMYLVRNGNNWHTVRKDGALGSRLNQLNRPALESALKEDAEFGPLNPGVTEIRGLSNGSALCVYTFYRPNDSFNVAPDTEAQGTSLRTRHKNIVVDLSLAAVRNTTAAYFSPDVIGRVTCFSNWQRR